MVRRHLNILTFNVRSLVDCSRRIDLLNSLRSNEIDIAFIQETHLKKGQRIFLENYIFLRDDTSLGVGIAIKKSLNFARIVIPNLRFPNLFIEMECARDGNMNKILLGSVYFPSNSSFSTINNGLSLVRDFTSTYDGVVLGGDFNSKNIIWGDNSNNVNGNYFLDWLNQFSLDFLRLSDTIPSYLKGCSFLDHFLISSNLIDTLNTNFRPFSFEIAINLFKS